VRPKPPTRLWWWVFIHPTKEAIVPPVSCWAVHWPDNHDEPIWLFDSELTAKGFARTISDPTRVTSEPILNVAQARDAIGEQRRGPVVA
jgi:hypothetical protein